MSFLSSAIIATNAITSWELYLLHRHRLAHQTAVIPPAFRETITPEAFHKTQHYARDTILFSMIGKVKSVVDSTVSLLIMPKVWYGVEAFTRKHVLPSLTRGGFQHALAFSLFADVLSTVIDLPFSYYRTFVIEERHGFNKTTKCQFAKDQLKLLLLRLCVLDPLVVGVMTGVVQKFGRKFPLYLFGCSTVVLTAATFIIPTFIQPLFNKFTPLPDGSLKTNVHELAKKLQFPLTKLYEIDGSRRSAHSNAYFYGFWNNKHIVLFDTLIKQLSEKEILAVLCHEFGHWKHNHTGYFFGLGLLQLLVFSFGAQQALFNEALYVDFGFQPGDLSPVIGFQLFTVVFFEPLSTLFEYFTSMLSRKFEFQADAFAVEMGYGEDLKSALRVIQCENKSSITPDWLFSLLHHTHPPLVARLDAVEANLKKDQ